MASLNPFQKAADILNQRKDDTDAMTDESPKPKVDPRTVKASPDTSRDPAERKELLASTSRLRDYRIKKNISGDTDAEARLAKLQSQPSSYKKGTKKVPKTGVAKLHKGEAVLNKKQAKKFRSRKGAARLLGSGRHPIKKVSRG